MKILTRIRRKIGNRLIRYINQDAFNECFFQDFPVGLHDAAQLVFNRHTLPMEKDIANQIESFRKRILTLSCSKEIESYSSPHSKTFRKDDKGHAIPGPKIESSLEAHMKTGVGKQGGLLLRRIAQGLGVKRILELGTNTGFSGCYFLSLPKIEQFVSVEGSVELCEIAKKNLNRISSNFRLLNMMFDDAIDLLREEKAWFDCVFIDGQHERQAVLHYMDRIRPLLKEGAAVIFDDIYWSYDMNQCWKELCRLPYFSKTIDLSSKGLCILRSRDETSTHHDICDYIGRPLIYRKGW